jgi:hypothetical protein
MTAVSSRRLDGNVEPAFAPMPPDRPDDGADGPLAPKPTRRRAKLCRCLDTLAERLALALTGGLGLAEFLKLVLADEVQRRDDIGPSVARAIGSTPFERRA